MLLRLVRIEKFLLLSGLTKPLKRALFDYFSVEEFSVMLKIIEKMKVQIKNCSILTSCTNIPTTFHSFQMIPNFS